MKVRHALWGHFRPIPPRPTSVATVPLADFVKAVNALRRRRKHHLRGTRGAPRTTLIYDVEDGLAIYTPFIRTVLPMEGEWVDCIAVEAGRLGLVAQKLPEAETVTLACLPAKLSIDGKRFVLAAEVGERPD